MNNCDTCVWATRNGGCASWGCDYIPMQEAAEAWKKERSEDPVKHGKWVMQGTAYGCSLCGEGVIHPFHNYCPNCGARMEGEEDE